MIEYSKSCFGINLMTRVHGSAMYKAIIPSLASVGVFLVIRFYFRTGLLHSDGDLLDHPYAVGVLVSSVTFLIAFRANYGYQRYWESCTNVHQFMSKILDCAVMCASFHMQCSHYDKIKPSSFFDHPELLRLPVCRERETGEGMKNINKVIERDEEGKFSLMRRMSFRDGPNGPVARRRTPVPAIPQSIDSPNSSNFDDVLYLSGKERLDGGWGLLNNEKIDKFGGLNQEQGKHWAKNRTPSVFLQELAHMSSLLIAVAFCTLRNDIEGSQSPLGTYIPGSPWPSSDPDKRTEEEQKYIKVKQNWFVKIFSFVFDVNRTAKARTTFNASRPMMVLGGVSDAEVEMLQRAKGPSAKTSLCMHWISEFIIREHLAGTLGGVGPPIVSRLFQFLSDGMIFYNHARKIMYIPFPFPHAQLSAIFIFVIIVAVPLLMEQYADQLLLGSVLTFVTVLCMAGMHEVARELENPYRNYPNEIPLGTLLAVYNEALVSMCTGFHPDAYWGFQSGRLSISPDTNLKTKKDPLRPEYSHDSEKLSNLEIVVSKQAEAIADLKKLLLEKRKVRKKEAKNR